MAERSVPVELIRLRLADPLRLSREIYGGRIDDQTEVHLVTDPRRCLYHLVVTEPAGRATVPMLHSGHIQPEAPSTAMPFETRSWYAWINKMPPPPDDFHVIGDVLASNPGVVATLTLAEPQGVNPRILLLELRIHQQPGMWPNVMTWVQARYDRQPSGTDYTEVTILHDGAAVQSIEVDTVH